MSVVKAKERHVPKGVGLKKLIKSRQLLLMLLPGLVFYILFRYVPMYGILVAFKKYSPFLGFFDSPWIGAKNFVDFFNSPDFWLLFRNTFLIGFYNLLWSFPAPVIFAITLNECRMPRLKKGVQTISYLPSFLSVVIVCSMAIDFLSPSGGIINRLIEALGGEAIYFMIKPEWFRTVYISTGMWSGVGTGSIVYLAALSNIDPQLYEAARVDGCGRLRAIKHITIPSILPTVMVMLILSVGSIIKVGFEKILILYNAATYPTADVFSTYVYRRGLQGGEFGIGTAVDLFNSIIALVFLYSTNALSRKFTDTSLW
jgi:putative aldouronate transport system permease protein